MPYTFATVLPTEGTILQVGDGAMTEVFTDIAQITVVDGPDSTVEDIKTTNMLSTAHEYRPSNIVENGELPFTFQWKATDALHIQLEADMGIAKTRHYQLVFNNGTSSRPGRLFSAYVKQFGRREGEVEQNVLVECILKITGPVTTTTVTTF
jgi:hypothetical protein